MATSNELLLRFFRSEDDPLIPHRHEDVVCFSDNDLEWYHNFIQWIFPTWQPSGACPNAPTIDEHFAEQLCADKCALKNFCKSCQRYLNYMNIDCDGNSHSTSCRTIIICGLQECLIRSTKQVISNAPKRFMKRCLR